MIYTYLEQLPKEFNFIKTGNSKYEDDFYKLIKSNDHINIKINKDLNQNETNITLDPKFYFENHKKEKINLYIISVDQDNSFFLNAVKYLKTNNIRKLEYNENNFKNFLIKNFPLRMSRWKFIKVLNFLKLSIRKNIIFKNFWYPKIFFKQHIYKGKLFGKGDYNCYLQRSKSFNNDFNFVYKNLSNERSKNNYKDIIYGKPKQIWKNYFNNLTSKEHYQHYLNFQNKDIINLGVEKGFEIPFFLSNNINSIINVDPEGEENLDEYVKFFINNNLKKVFFEKSFLYNSSRIETKLPIYIKSINLIDIITKYNLKDNFIIKSDIEGLEIEILNEIPKIMRKFRPQFAISIYHLDNNLFPYHSQITLLPKMLIKYCKNYKFFVEHYSYNRGETVFYCIPD